MNRLINQVTIGGSHFMQSFVSRLKRSFHKQRRYLERWGRNGLQKGPILDLNCYNYFLIKINSEECFDNNFDSFELIFIFDKVFDDLFFIFLMIF